MKKTFLMGLLCLSVTFTIGQKNTLSQKSAKLVSKYSKEANNAFDAELFHDAIDLYKKAFQKARGNRIEKQRIIFQIAMCYRLNVKYLQAEKWFGNTITAGHLDPLAYLYLADAKKQNGKYDEALAWYQKYAQKLPDDQKGKDGIKSCQLVMEWIDTKSRYEIEINNAFNTTFDDFSPTYGKKDYRLVYFTSARPAGTGQDIDGITELRFSIKDLTRCISRNVL
ncbi:MAG: tetratricopeptide repeat protein [Bacteroidetes bacterium]|nr:tetratricopeptide repeat protein [Bacteroidota bacterium]